MVITKIERQKRHPHRVSIFCGDEFTIGVHEDLVVKFGLRTGDTLTEHQLHDLQSAEELNLAKEKALRYIGYRRRSEKEIRMKLTEKEFHPSVIDCAVDHLKNIGVLDDRAFATAFVHDLLMKKPAGSKLIRQRLRLKGVSDTVIKDILQEQFGSEAELTLAREAAARQMKRYATARKKHERLKQQKRLADFLARRGFGWDTVSSIMKEFFPSSKVQ